MKKIFLLLVISSILIFAKSEPLSLPFFSKSVSLQVLGSGGPEMGDRRASSAYLIWINGKSRILIDFGGGASLRFEQSRAKIKDLQVILLTHLHVDHTADLPALLKGSFFTRASGVLDIYGPSGNNVMPNTRGFINRLFNKDSGAWEYLGDHLDGGARLQLKAHNIKESKKLKVIYEKNGIRIIAVSVHHGPIPSIAYRVEVGSKSVTFSGDMNGDYHTLEKLAKGTNILVAHNAVPKNANKVARSLHMTPFIIGEIAQKARVKSLVLSHRMLRTLGREKETRREVKRNYRGKIRFANDNSKYRVK
ncbi:MAG: MBL fold metallo-hydrolase [Sulfurovum sp.]